MTNAETGDYTVTFANGAVFAAKTQPSIGGGTQQNYFFTPAIDVNPDQKSYSLQGATYDAKSSDGLIHFSTYAYASDATFAGTLNPETFGVLYSNASINSGETYVYRDLMSGEVYSRYGYYYNSLNCQIKCNTL